MTARRSRLQVISSLISSSEVANSYKLVSSAAVLRCLPVWGSQFSQSERNPDRFLVIIHSWCALKRARVGGETVKVTSVVILGGIVGG